MRLALRKAGLTFPLDGQITYPFDADGLKFGGERVILAQNGLRCDLPCAGQVAPNIGHVSVGATCLVQGGWHQIWGTCFSRCDPPDSINIIRTLHASPTKSKD